MAMRKGLGKGLGALIGDYNEQPDAPSEGAVTLPLQKIEPNPLQPRKTFNPEELDSLADSIRMHGIIQPLTVRRLPSGFYQIIAKYRTMNIRSSQANAAGVRHGWPGLPMCRSWSLRPTTKRRWSWR
mgnify:CR=1 FL=1